MFKKFAVVAILITVLMLSVVAVYTQQGGGNGNGPNNPANDTDEPQMNAYRHGGLGFVNPQSGQRWNGQQRGQMNRGAGMNGTGMYTSLPPATVDELPQAIIDLMIQGWTDEQQAYAAYESIMGQFGEITPFVNIHQAEVQHVAAWEFLFDRYSITVPNVPEFEIPTFASPQEACALGAQAEIANFALYDEMLEAFETYPDIYQVALALRNASEFNHLPAFENCAGS